MAIADLTEGQLFGQMFDATTGAVRTTGSGGGTSGSANLSPVSTATLSTVASLATSQQLLAANANRKGVLAVNTDANAMKGKYGTTASGSSFSFVVPGNNGQWEMPQPIYQGRIDGIWDADGSGSLFLTEF